MAADRQPSPVGFVDGVIEHALRDGALVHKEDLIGFRRVMCRNGIHEAADRAGTARDVNGRQVFGDGKTQRSAILPPVPGRGQGEDRFFIHHDLKTHGRMRQRDFLKRLEDMGSFGRIPFKKF